MVLFIVDCAAACTPSARNSAEVTAWLVSTFPAITAAGYAGDSIVRGGRITLSGFITPSFIGMSSSTRQRNT